MAEQNKELFRRFVAAVPNGGNLDSINDFFDPHFSWHGPGEDFTGTEREKQNLAAYREAFPDLHFRIDDMVAEGDKVALRWTSTGTHKADLMGIPATNKKMTMPGVTIARFSGGRIVEEWESFDLFGMMQQLGVVPS